MSSVSVGFVSKRSGVSVATLHFYEEKGLIKSARTAGNQRRYERSVLRKVAIIKAAQALGLTLKEIGETLNDLPNDHTPNKSDWTHLAGIWKAKLDQKIHDLMLLRDELDQCIGCGCLSLDYCKLRNPDDLLAKEGNGAVLWGNDNQ